MIWKVFVSLVDSEWLTGRDKASSKAESKALDPFKITKMTYSHREGGFPPS
jgi:hypothetical protein